jgi:hypothetical protein
VAERIPDNHVIVRFGKNIPGAAQAKAMLAFERLLRELTAAEIEVFKDTMGDDSKLRVMMTPDERMKL